MLTAWTCTNFTGHNPVGTAAVVIAHTAQQASNDLNKELEYRGLPADTKPKDMVRFALSKRTVKILNDGDY